MKKNTNQIAKYFKNLTLGQKIGACLWIVLSFTIIIGLSGHIILSRIMEGITFYDQVYSIQKSFSQARYYHDQFRLYAYADGRIMQHHMKDRVLKNLGDCSQLIDKLNQQLIDQMNIEIKMAQAIQEFKKYSIFCHQYIHTEERKESILKKIDLFQEKLAKKIYKMPFEIESIDRQFKYLSLIADNYFERSVEKTWIQLKQNIEKMEQCIQEWQAQTKQNSLLKKASDQLMALFISYRGLYFQYNLECETQDNFKKEMTVFQDAFAGMLQNLIHEATNQMYRMQVVSTIVMLAVLVISLIVGAGISIFLARKTFIKPIIELDHAAKLIAEGQYEMKMPVFDGKDELCSLSRSFYKMQQAIHEQMVNIHEARQQYQSIFENAVEGIYQVTTDGRFLKANPSLASILGFKSIGKLIQSTQYSKPFSFFTAKDRIQLMEQLKADKQVKNYEAQLILTNGEPRWCSLVARIEGESWEKCKYIEGSIVDITERIERNRAQQERKAAELASKAKSEFLANMSHEIRTPMNGVVGMVELLLMMELSPRQKEYIDAIACSAESLLTVLNDILDYSKIEAGRLIIESVCFQLRDTVEQVGQLMAAQARNKDIDILVHYPPDLPTYVFGDPTRIRQILNNLSNNAIKFTEKGYVLINIQQLEKNDMAGKFLFQVIDTGIGISEENQNKVFEKFTQADGSTSRKYGGTGLGLSICQQLIQMMGGEIGLKSQLHKGTTFHFTLELPVAKEQKSIGDTKDLSCLSVLVVDDNPVHQEILQDYFSAWNVRCKSVDNAKQALERLRHDNKAFNIAMIDLHLPEIDGLTLAQHIYKEQLHQNMSLILITSGIISDDIYQEAKRFFSAILTKPIRFSSLYNTISTIDHKKETSISNACKESDQEQQFNNINILLVEDNVVNQKVTKGILNRMGCTVEIAENGLIAIQKLEKQQFDLIFMDANMPVMDGFDATREIRKKEEKTQQYTPIIAMTALAMVHDRERCFSAGMDDFIAKPINIQTIVHVINKYCKNYLEKNEKAISKENNITTSDHADSEEIFDQEQLMNVCGKDADIILEIIDIFSSDALKYIQDLFQYQASNDPQNFFMTLHTFKGNSANIGARKLQKMIHALEKQSNRSQLPDRASIESIKKETDHCIYLLKSIDWKGLTSNANTND